MHKCVEEFWQNAFVMQKTVQPIHSQECKEQTQLSILKKHSVKEKSWQYQCRFTKLFKACITEGLGRDANINSRLLRSGQE